MTRRSRQSIRAAIADLEDTLSPEPDVTEWSTSELYIAALEVGMCGGPDVPDDLADEITAEYQRRIARRSRGGLPDE